MYPGFHEPGSALAVGMNTAWWDQQSASDKAIIEACCHADVAVTLSEFTARNGDALAALVNDHGVKLHAFPEDVWKAIAEASEQVVEEAGREDEMGTRI